MTYQVTITPTEGDPIVVDGEEQTVTSPVLAVKNILHRVLSEYPVVWTTLTVTLTAD